MEINNPDKKYTKKKHGIYSCQYHVIFCPKYRRPVLTSGLDKALNELILDLQKEYSFKVIEMEIMPDHVHLLLSVDPYIGIYEVVKKIKGRSAHDLRRDFPFLKSRLPTLWTRSSFISTCGAVTLEVVKRYIQEQKNV